MIVTQWHGQRQWQRGGDGDGGSDSDSGRDRERDSRRDKGNSVRSMSKRDRDSATVKPVRARGASSLTADCRSSRLHMVRSFRSCNRCHGLECAASKLEVCPAACNPALTNTLGCSDQQSRRVSAIEKLVGLSQVSIELSSHCGC